MSKLVNYKKRSFLLPTGCKDLVDVLEPSRRHANAHQAGWTTAHAEAHQAKWTTAPQVRNDHFRTAGLDHVAEYVSRMSATSSNFMTVMITHDERCAPVVLLRNRGENVFAIALYEQQPVILEAVRAFFLQQGIEPIEDLSATLPGQFSSLIYPLPLDEPKATALATALLRTAYGVKDGAGLRFRSYEAETGV